MRFPWTSLMQVRKRLHGGVTVIELIGRFDVTEAPRFEGTFKDLVMDKPKNVAFDFTGVEYIDSSGIGALIKAFNIVRTNNGEMILFALRTPVLAVFKVAQLDTFFNILTKEDFERKYPR